MGNFEENSFESLAKEIREVEADERSLVDFEKQATTFERLSADEKLKVICRIYKKIRPLLLILIKLPFVTPTIKQIIRVFGQTMDKICPA
ncbi:MAG: hypothetical protein CL840_18940 [Crocinitomicaceae bacterium]|nr:hypothetical protein [Crocinitomicaceae bacterium]|tara:strand:- start:10228 stop:10497 length:270 start_codon:yes stop_codon:yes gene_type:complete